MIRAVAQKVATGQYVKTVPQQGRPPAVVLVSSVRDADVFSLDIDPTAGIYVNPPLPLGVAASPDYSLVPVLVGLGAQQIVN